MTILITNFHFTLNKHPASYIDVYIDTYITGRKLENFPKCSRNNFQSRVLQRCKKKIHQKRIFYIFSLASMTHKKMIKNLETKKNREKKRKEEENVDYWCEKVLAKYTRKSSNDFFSVQWSLKTRICF